jgi:hypothetical protein
MLLLFVAVLVSFLAASVAANFAVIFTVVDQAVTTTTTSSGLLEVKGTGAIAKTAIATEDLPLIAAPALDLDTLAQVKSLKVTYGPEAARVEAQLNIVGVRKHNSTFVEFITDVPGETVETLNGKSSLVVYTKKDPRRPTKHTLCSGNATCSAFSASGIDRDAIVESAVSSLVEHGFIEESRARQLQAAPGLSIYCQGSGNWVQGSCSGGANGCSGGIAKAYWVYHDGYYGLKHVVFGLHGLKGRGGYPYDNYCDKCQMDKICGSYNDGPCDDMTNPEFEHLVFIFPSSSMVSYNKFTWSSSNGNTETFTAGLENLAEFLCNDEDGFDGPCDGSAGVTGIGHIDDLSQVMILGMSNGGGAGVYGAVKYNKITGVVAVDYYGQNGPSETNAQISTWLPANTGSPLAFVKVYTACDSSFFQNSGFTTGSVTFASVYTLSAGAAVPVLYPTAATAPAWFVEYSWTSADMAVYFARHGSSDCDDTTICHAGTGTTCSGNQIHNWLNHYADYPNDVLEWVHDPSPPPSPPAVVGISNPPKIKISHPIKEAKKFPKTTCLREMPAGPPPTKLGTFPTSKKTGKLPNEFEFVMDEKKAPGLTMKSKTGTLLYRTFSRGRF